MKGPAGKGKKGWGARFSGSRMLKCRQITNNLILAKWAFLIDFFHYVIDITDIIIFCVLAVCQFDPDFNFFIFFHGSISAHVAKVLESSTRATLKETLRLGDGVFRRILEEYGKEHLDVHYTDILYIYIRIYIFICSQIHLYSYMMYAYIDTCTCFWIISL